MTPQIYQGILLVLLSLLHQSTAQACEGFAYVQYADQHVSGGTRDTNGDTSLAACQGICSLSSSCVGVDYTTTSQCWLVTTYVTAITPDASVDHYRFQSSCLQQDINRHCVFGKAGAFTFDAGVVTAAASEALCEAACVRNAACAGFDWQNAGPTCRLILSDANTAARSNNVNARAYNRLRCEDCPAYDIFTNRVITNNAVPRNDLTSLQACLDTCSSTPDCSGFNWVAVTSTCSFLLDSNADQFRSSMVGTSNYWRLCQASTTTVATTIDNGGCTQDWTAKNNTSVSGGMSQSFPTFAACQAGCVADDNCVAIDVDYNANQNLCWFHFNQAALANTRTSTNVFHYVLNDRCVTVCGPSFPTVKNNTSSPNGTPTGTIPTLEACQAACIANANCLAIDVDFSGGTLCWIHTTAANLETTRTTTNIYQYTISRTCDGTTVFSTTDSGTTAAGCQPVWDIRNDTSSQGGNAKSFGTVEQCLSECVEDENCVAADIDFRGGTLCWHHVNGANIATTRDTTSVYQYRLETRCGSVGTTSPACAAAWDIRNNTNSNGGVAMGSLTTVADCLATCVDDDDCVAADIDFNGGTLCWHHSNAANLDTTRMATEVYQYRLVSRCDLPTTTPGCQPVWNTLDDTSSLGGTAKSASTAAECLSACVDDTACVGADIDNNGGTLCWHHTNADNFQSTRTSPNVNQNRLVTRCGETTTQPACVVVWSTKNNTNSQGGQAFADATDMASCLEACVDNDACVGADVNFGGGTLCWLHTDAANLDVTGSASNVYQYKLEDRCAGGTTVPGCGDPIWKITNNTHAFNGVARSEYTSLAACTAACLADDACFGVDVDFTTNAISLCWFHTNAADFSDTESLTGVYLYEIVDRCPGSGTTAPGCVPVWDITNNTHAFNGIAFAEAATAAECLSACVDEPSCMGVDVDFATNALSLCWFHTNVGDFSDTGPMTGTYLYRLVDRCPDKSTTRRPTGSPTLSPCVPEWRIRNNTHAFNGIERTDLTDPAACLAACIDDTSCVGVDLDFDSRNTLCWFHTNVNDISDTGPQTDAYFYQLVDRCPARCTPEWVERAGQHAFNGIEFPGANTQAECLKACIDDPSCIAVDIDTNPGGTFCWVHRDVSDLNQLGTQNGLTLWILQDRCPGPGPTPTAGPLVCGVHEYLSTNVNGGMNMGVFSSPYNCMAQCFFASNCVASDFDTRTGECYFHETYNARQRNTCCTRYEFVCQQGGCFDKFETYNNQVGRDGFLRSGVTTSEGCGNVCLAENNCFGYDFRRAQFSATCITHNRPYGDSLSFNSQYDANSRVRCIIPDPPTVGPTTGVECVGDLVFILDESGTVNENALPGATTNYDLVKQFVKNIVQSITISRERVRVGIVTYSNNARVRFDLDDHTDVSSVLAAIDNIPYMGGSSNTPAALATAAVSVFSAFGGDRESVGNTVVLVTDGETSSNVASNLNSAIQTLKSRVSNIFVVGVTNRVRLGELRRIATSNNNVVTVNSFQDLRTALDFQDLGICTAPTPVTIAPTPATPPPTLAPTPGTLQCRLDLVLVVDSSGSIEDDNPANFGLVKNFLKRLLDELDRDRRLEFDVRVAALSFGSRVEVTFFLDNGRSRSSQFYFDIDRMYYDGGNTNTVAALRRVNSDILVEARGARSDVPDVALVITDGKPTVDVDELPSAVRALKNRGVRIVGVGVTSRVNETIMRDIVSEPFEPNYYPVNDFDKLTTELDSILRGTCEEITTPAPAVLRCALDLAFVVDSSGSINDKDPRNWNLTLAFLTNIIAKVNISETRMSALSFSNNAIIGFDFDNGFTTKDEYYTAINRLRYDGGTTNTTGALRAARTRLFTPSRGDRPDVSNFMMVLTDGINTVEETGFVAETQNVKNSNIRVMALGVTNDVSEAELNQMASNDRNGNPLVYIVENFIDLDLEIIDILTAAKTCEES